MAVSKCVPADPAQPCFLCRRNKPVLLNSAWPIWFSCFGICEYPILGFHQRSYSRLVLTQLLRKRIVKRHPSMRSLRFHFALVTVDVGLPHCQAQPFPVDVSPSQTEDLTHPQSQTHRHNAHRSKRLWNVFKQLPKFSNGKCLRFPLPFRTVLDADQAHGIVLIRNQLPAHGRIKKDTHQVFEMRLAFRCQVEPLEPVLNEQWFDLLDGMVSPLGSTWFFSQQRYREAVEILSGISS